MSSSRWTADDLAALQRRTVKQQLQQYLPKHSKYYAHRTQIICPARGQLWFHSKREAIRYQELRLQELAKDIADLELQPEYDLIASNGEVVTHYHADFRYRVVATGQIVVEDVKSAATQSDRAWGVRVRWAEACHAIKITIVH